MSAPTEENKKPAGIESFLIVAYRSLRGRKSGVSYRERNLIDASAEQISHLAEKFLLITESRLDLTHRFLFRQKDPLPELYFFLFKGRSSARSHPRLWPGLGELYQQEHVLEVAATESLMVHQSGYSGLTILIYRNNIVFVRDQFEILTFNRDENTGKVVEKLTSIKLSPKSS